VISGPRTWLSRSFLMLLILGMGCASVPDFTYFTMAYTLLPQRHKHRALAESLRVSDMEITPAYDKDKIVYRFSPYQFQYYNYMLWAVKPNKMVTGLVVRHLEHSGLFEVVSRDYGETRPQYEMSGVLEAIEELDSGDEWFAHIALSLRLTRFRNDAVVWSYRIDKKKRVYNKEPVYVVKALSELMEQGMNEVVEDLRGFLSRNQSVLKTETKGEDTP